MLRCIFLIFISFAIITSCNQNDGNKESAQLTEEPEYEKLQEEGKLGQEGAVFLAEDIYYSNLLLIQYNEMAERKASIVALQNFAAQSAQYHRNMKQEIEQMAAQLNVDLPSELGNLVEEHIQEMEGKSGNEFDKVYLQVLNDIQEEMIRKYEEVSESITDRRFNNWLEKFISNTKAHQLAVNELLKEAESR